MAYLIYVKPSVRNFSPCDYALNHFADNKIKKKAYQHIFQLFSCVTHSADLLLQAALLPPLLMTNPFITVGVNIANKQWRAIPNALLIPFKLISAAFNIPLYEAKMAVKLTWSLSGANALVNVAKGKKQTDAFFLKRKWENALANELNDERKRLKLNSKKVISIPGLYVPKGYKNKSRVENLAKSISENDFHTFGISRASHCLKLTLIYNISTWVKDKFA